MALWAQGFADGLREKPADGWALRKVLSRVGLIQIDSVNVLARAHYLPRVQPPRRRTTPAMLDRLSHYAPRRLFEYWGHEASLLPVELQPLLRWRMAPRARRRVGRHARGSPRERPELVARGAGGRARARAGDRRAARASSTSRAQPKGPWWDWSRRQARARVPVLERRRSRARGGAGFERLYDLPERVLPRRGASRRRRRRTTTPSASCVRIAARALGVATERRPARLLPAAGRAECAGARRRARRGGRAAAGRGRGLARARPTSTPGARVPRRVDARALRRAVRLAGLGARRAPSGCSASATGSRSTCPAPKRVHGYYVLPFLLGDRLVARVDLKADRAGGRAARAGRARRARRRRPRRAEALAAELRLHGRLAGARRRRRSSAAGDLAPALRPALASVA